MLASVTGVPPRSGCWGKIFQGSCPNPPILPQNHVASDSPDQCLTASDSPARCLTASDLRQATAGCACRAAIPFAILQRAVRSLPSAACRPQLAVRSGRHRRATASAAILAKTNGPRADHRDSLFCGALRPHRAATPSSRTSSLVWKAPLAIGLPC